MENRGLLAASAEALLHARGRYVGLFAADDYLHPGFGARMRHLADRYPDAGILAQEVTIRALSQEVRRYRFGVLRESGYLSPHALSGIMRYRYFWLPTAAAFLRRDLLTEAGGWRMELDWLADWYAAYDVAWRFGVAWNSHPGAEIAENPASFGRAGANDPGRRAAVLNAFFDLLHREARSGLRDRLLHAPIALLGALGDDLPDLLAARTKDHEFRLAVTQCMGERVRLGRIGRLASLFL
jgi:glycosyltransferase involved in cell wall biosynthesis